MKKNGLPQNREEGFRILAELEKELKEEANQEGESFLDKHSTMGLWIRNNWIYGQGDKVLKLFDIDSCFVLGDFASSAILDEYFVWKKECKHHRA